MDSHQDFKSMYAKLVDSLNCAICQDVLKDARDLECGHTFCMACLGELVAIEGWTSNIQCCLCQRKTSIRSGGVNGLKQNYKLNCILDEQASILKKMEASDVAVAATPGQQDSPEAPLQIWVRDLEGKSQSFLVRTSDTADAFKRQVEKKIGIPPNVQRLLFQSKQLEGSTTLDEYGIGLHSTIELALPLKGGKVILAIHRLPNSVS
ncbi:E3 ubiquitin-protein ligase TRIM31-like [Lytechinus variegatus]|uniref:E3 ubiquitin-protein ligase TRIM31-like n=1 Tax=Lytechinus variegatus TaxID=7654 RepID=UPI001BB1FBB4|nr:E3 ubiquitin-protein ligase TRIM31-like [Lytechinus variegatus]